MILTESSNSQEISILKRRRLRPSFFIHGLVDHCRTDCYFDVFGRRDLDPRDVESNKYPKRTTESLCLALLIHGSGIVNSFHGPESVTFVRKF